LTLQHAFFSITESDLFTITKM